MSAGVERAVRAAELVGLVTQRPGVPDGADLGEIPPERQADGPIDHGAKLPEETGDLDQVVGPGEPPGNEAGEGLAAQPADGLVAAEIDEGRAARIRVAPRAAD